MTDNIESNNGKSVLCNFLKDFLPKHNKSFNDCENNNFYNSSMNNKHIIIERCMYCGKTEKQIPITIGTYNENICSECKCELLYGNIHFKQIVYETIYNLESLFSIQWNKQIQIKETAILKPLVSKPKFIISNYKKRQYSVWKEGIQKNIFQIKIQTKKESCILKIRTNTPVGTVTAEIVYAIINDYLNMYMQKESINEKQISGIALWYMVHYLYIMDYGKYGDYYSEKIINEQDKEISNIYKTLKQKYNKKGEVMSLNWGIKQIFDEENMPFCYVI